MLLSMTGFGDARCQNEQTNIAVEVRSVNNRYLKVATKAPDAYSRLEGEIEKLVRSQVGRGTISVVIRLDRAGLYNPFSLNREILEDYIRQLRELAEEVGIAAPDNLGNLLDLPGVVFEETSTQDGGSDWPNVKQALEEALKKLNAFRLAEGKSMERELRMNCGEVAAQLELVRVRAPQVVQDFRDRLKERVSELLQASEADVHSDDLIRDVSIFSERCDITEELTRLQAHLEQFEHFLVDEVSQGRKLDFLTQEMFREVNTIGSKANNVEISHAVVEMKAAVEKMREILQNIQ